MIRTAGLVIYFLTTPAAAQTDSPWLNWVIEHSPHGFDMTPDGTLWINVSPVGNMNDYAIRAEDLRDAREAGNRKPSFWIRGFHKLNPKVQYRESKARLNLDCGNETLSTSTAAYYDADGNILGRTGPSAAEHIIPGSYGAEYYRLFCIIR